MALVLVASSASLGAGIDTWAWEGIGKSCYTPPMAQQSLGILTKLREDKMVEVAWNPMACWFCVPSNVTYIRDVSLHHVVERVYGVGDGRVVKVPNGLR